MSLTYYSRVQIKIYNEIQTKDEQEKNRGTDIDLCVDADAWGIEHRKFPT